MNSEKVKSKIDKFLSKLVDFWQGMRDSNPRKRSQSPVCYRYTNPLYAVLFLKSTIIISSSFHLSSIIFIFSEIPSCGRRGFVVSYRKQKLLGGVIMYYLGVDLGTTNIKAAVYS